MFNHYNATCQDLLENMIHSLSFCFTHVHRPQLSKALLNDCKSRKKQLKVDLVQKLKGFFKIT